MNHGRQSVPLLSHRNNTPRYTTTHHNSERRANPGREGAVMTTLNLGPEWTDKYGRKRGGVVSIKTLSNGVVCWCDKWGALILSAIDGHPSLTQKHYGPETYGHVDIILVT